VFQIWWRSVRGFSVGWGSNFAIPHWLWWSFFQHSHTTMWACDTSTVTKLIIHRVLFFPTFLQRSSLFHASGLDNPFPVSRGRICLTSFDSVTPKTPTRRKDLWDMCHTSWVIAHFVSNFIAMATRVGRCKIWLTWLIDWAWFYISTNTVRLYGRWANLIDIVRELDPKDVVAMATGSVVVEFVWHHSIARPRKPPDRCRDLGDI